MARGRHLGATLALLLGGCVFIDDFERFRGVGDGGSPDDGVDAGAEPDAEVPGADAAESDARADDAESGTERDARAADAARDAEAGTTTPDTGPGPGPGPDDSGGPGPTDANVPEPDASSMPAPGCASAAIVPTQRCYPDLDRDRFPDLGKPAVVACDCPVNTIAVANPSEAMGDCWDDPATRGADVHPGQETFFPIGYGGQLGNYDYDCDGTERKEFAVLPAPGCSGLLGLLCSATKGFVRETQCGRQEDFISCGPNGLAGCAGSNSTRVQGCR